MYLGINNKNDKAIILKEGYNRGLIVGIIVFFTIFLVLITSKLWLPDGRNNMTSIKSEELFFNNCSLNLEKDMYFRNKNENIGELHFKELAVVSKEKKDYSIKIVDENNNKLPVKVMKGNSNKTEEDSVLETNYIVQFGLPKDFYYITIEIENSDVANNFTIDYRNFKNDNSLKEKNENYLLDIEKYTIDIKGKKEEIKVLETEIKKTEKEYNIVADELKKQELLQLITNNNNVLKEKKLEQKTLEQQLEKYKEGN